MYRFSPDVAGQLVVLPHSLQSFHYLLRDIQCIFITGGTCGYKILSSPQIKSMSLWLHLVLHQKLRLKGEIETERTFSTKGHLHFSVS